MSCAELAIAGIMPFPISTKNMLANPDSNIFIDCRRACYRIGWLIGCLSSFATGCNFVPDLRHRPQYHNPFPQLSTVAVLPFRNQSEDPTLNGARVTLAYYNELQAIPGFEVIPVGVVESQLASFEQQVLQHAISGPQDMQRFAQYLGVDAVLQGAITDYDAYYPPRITLKVNWYAANEGFHPIPAGYGLPWGTKAEKKIPEWVRLESERTLAREQLKTQTPTVKTAQSLDSTSQPPSRLENESMVESVKTANHTTQTIADLRIDIPSDSKPLNDIEVLEPIPMASMESISFDANPLDGPSLNDAQLPVEWPDPHGFIPSPPQPVRPVANAQSLPIISHMRTYNGHDEDFTQQLSDYYYFRDDARFGGWEAYLQRSEDFIRFCCHSHIVETLAARGGQLQSRTVVRWPINRYER